MSDAMVEIRCRVRVRPVPGEIGGGALRAAHQGAGFHAGHEAIELEREQSRLHQHQAGQRQQYVEDGELEDQSAQLRTQRFHAREEGRAGCLA